MENKIKQYRTTLLINGIIALLFGALSLFLPVTTIKTVVKYFGILLFLGGATGIYFSVQHMKNDKPYLQSLIVSIVSLVMGVVLFFNTRQSLIIFATIIGIWALVIGAVQLFIALKLLQKGNYRKTLIINSIITLVFGLLLFLNPFGSVLFLVYVVGAFAVVIGGILLFFSFSLKSSE